MDFTALPKDQQELLRQWMQTTLNMATLLVPGVTPEKIASKVDVFIEEHFQINEQIIPSLVEPTRIEAYPYMQLIVRHVSDTKGDNEVVFTIKKAVDMGSSHEEVFTRALLLAFLFAPVARLLLTLHGYTYRFQDVKQVVKKPIFNQ